MGENKGKKKIQEKCQKVLNELLKVDDNKYCADCDSKGPRWASWNIGVFLCIRCAGIHRNLGVHISKVKSVNLDAWTPQQVVTLRGMGGNSRARAVYEAELPDNFRRPQNDSSLESFIRAKYEQKKYIAREYVPPSPPSPRTDWERALDDNGDGGGNSHDDEGERVTRIIMSEKKIDGEVEYYKDAEVPQLPKPGAGKGNPVSLTGIRNRDDVKENQNKHKPSDDLLGEDNFSNFVSAPLTDPATKNETNAIVSKTEEEDFFNQISGPTGILGTAPPKEKAKLDKDSIMALYGATPANSFGSFWSGNGLATAGATGPAACHTFSLTNPPVQYYGGVQGTVQPSAAAPQNYWNNIPTTTAAAYQNRYVQLGNVGTPAATGSASLGINSIFPNPFLKNHQ